MGDENAVNVHISRLRTKIEDDPRKPQVVITVWGIGYKLGITEMSNATNYLFYLTLCIMILICIIVYEQFVFHNGTKAKIHEISSKLKELLDTDSDEKLIVFTDNKELRELANTESIECCKIGKKSLVYRVVVNSHRKRC